MRAVIFDGTIQVVDIPKPSPAAGEALIRVLVAGICNTDLEIIKGYMGFEGVLGHEFVGVVEQAATPGLVGKRVVGEINCVCHACAYCQMEMPHHCLDRTVLGIVNRNGAFAEYLTLPEENLHLVPGNLRDDVAVFTEPLAAAFRILQQISITPEQRVIVLGDGKLGQLCAQVIWLKTKRMVCVGKHRWKLQLLKNLGIPVLAADEFLEGGADVVVEATGSGEGLSKSLRLVRPEGTIVLKTTVAHTTDVDISIPVVNEIRMLGSRCGPFRPALEALGAGVVSVRPLVTEMFELVDAVAAFRCAQDTDTIKVLFNVTS